MTITFETRLYHPSPLQLVELRTDNGLRWVIMIHLN
jgi:hypothetical protein